MGGRRAADEGWTVKHAAFIIVAAPRRGALTVRAAATSLAGIMIAGAVALAPPLARAQTAASDSYDANLLGDMAGLRPFLAANGLTFSLNNTSELLGNPTGGLRQELVFEGGALATLTLDGGKAGLWPGLTLQVSAWGLYGRGLSANALDDIDTASNVEANRSLRLLDLWAEQAFAGGKASLRVGQMGVDEEFAIDQYAAPFVNAEDGFPVLPSYDLPGGGPAFPLATPAVRLKFQPSDSTTVLVALFNGNPAPGKPLFGPADGEAQNLDGSGTTLRTDGGALWFGEVQYAASPGGQPGTYKFGAWYNSNVFDDQRLDNTGRSLADPASTGQPLPRRGDWSFYALADQQVFKPAHGDGSVGVFLRAMGAPGDRNQIDYSVNGGLNWQGIIAGRPDDTLAVGFEWSRFGDQVSKLDGDIARFTGQPYPVQRWESFLELTYQTQILKWLQLQPDLQYVLRPGGGVPQLNDPTRPIGDALVLGLRTSVTF